MRYFEQHTKRFGLPGKNSLRRGTVHFRLRSTGCTCRATCCSNFSASARLLLVFSSCISCTLYSSSASAMLVQMCCCTSQRALQLLTGKDSQRRVLCDADRRALASHPRGGADTWKRVDDGRQCFNGIFLLFASSRWREACPDRIQIAQSRCACGYICCGYICGAPTRAQ